MSRGKRSIPNPFRLSGSLDAPSWLVITRLGEYEGIPQLRGKRAPVFRLAYAMLFLQTRLRRMLRGVLERVAAVGFLDRINLIR